MKKLKTYFLLMVASFIATPLLAGIITVAPGEDIRAAYNQAASGDTIFIPSGEYRISGHIELTKDIALIGDPTNIPVVYFTNFVPGNRENTLVLENLHLIFERKYLIYGANNKECDMKEIVLRKCVVNLNGEVGSSVILNRSTGGNNRIGRILIDGCVIYNAQSASHGLINISKESTVQISSIQLKNSTFTDFARGVMIVNAPMNDLKVDVENCTFYNMNTSENPGAIFHFSEGNTEIKIKRSVFHLAGTSPKLIDAGSGGIVTVTDSYAAKAQSKIRNPYGLKILKGDARTVFASPDNDPLDGCTSFRLIDKAIADLQIGDPRWK